ncbi:hypothetical protein CRG98_006296 [Punica granatum]|uniref:Uncharacterized protein n=1 Tax=Punica granatum TaxID=22663 RepID=A0A2I0KXZ7_PUNGR|nr:hypothetical protein CRG98_006296 [Punica granatum]
MGIVTAAKKGVGKGVFGVGADATGLSFTERRKSETHRTRSRHDELGIEVEEFEMATTGGVDGGVGKTMKR